MARARPRDPPRASSSEEEGIESGSGDEVHKNEDKSHAKQQENKNSSDDDESEEESDEVKEESSEEEEAEPTSKISTQKKPQTRKALEGEAFHFTVKRNAPEKASPGKPAVVSKTPFNRAAKTALEEPNKKQKTVMVADGHEPNKTIFSSEKRRPAFTRLWSEADEIALLKGMIEFGYTRGNDPMSDISKFYEFIKKSNSVQCDVSKRQIIDKVKKLRKKYKINVGKCTGSDEHPVFPKAHDSEIFDLSKKLWESGANRAAGSRKSVDVPKNRNVTVIALPKHGGKNTNTLVKEKNGADSKPEEERGKCNTNTLVKEKNGADPKPEEERGKCNTNTLMKENNGAADPKPEEEDVKMEEEVYKVDLCKKEVSEMYPFIYEAMQSMDGMNFSKVLVLCMMDKSKMKDLEQKAKKHKLAEVELACEKMKCVKDMLELIVTSGY